MSIAMLDHAAGQLGSLCERVVFLGGASLALWIDDPAAPEPRVTTDVDVIVAINSTVGYYALGDELRDRGFSEDIESGIICRWRHPVA